jgi:hypothetical protein
LVCTIIILLLGASQLIYVGYYQGTGEADREMIDALPVARAMFILGIVLAAASAVALVLSGRPASPSLPTRAGGAMPTTRVVGIVLSLLGGVGLLLFGGSAATAHQQMFMTRQDEMATASVLYVLTAVSVLVFLVGLVMIGRGSGGPGVVPPSDGGGGTGGSGA